MKTNFDPQTGKKNLSNLLYGIPNYQATVNSLQVIPDQPDTRRQSDEGVHAEQEDTQSHSIADIEEIPIESDTAYVQSVLVNKIRIGQACCPYEVIRIKVGAGYFPVTLIYDTGAQISLCNFETGPLLLRSKNADRRATISTINSTRAKLRRIHTLTLGDGCCPDT